MLMHSRLLQHASSIPALVACGGMALSFYFMFKAGCAGDPKTGTLGSPASALEIEATAALPFVVSLVCAAIAVGLSGIAASLSRQIAFARVFVPIAGVFCWLLSMRIEWWGSQSCFA